MTAARSHARLGNQAAAADAFRKAIEYFDGAGRDANRVTLRIRALEQAMLASDRQGARNDLALLREAHRAALLGGPASPAQRQLLAIAENAIARFEPLLR